MKIENPQREKGGRVQLYTKAEKDWAELQFPCSEQGFFEQLGFCGKVGGGVSVAGKFSVNREFKGRKVELNHPNTESEESQRIKIVKSFKIIKKILAKFCLYATRSRAESGIFDVHRKEGGQNTRIPLSAQRFLPGVLWWGETQSVLNPPHVREKSARKSRG